MHVAKLFLPAVAALAFSVPAMAQQMGGGTPSVDDQVNQLDEMVDLNDGQKEELSNLLTQMQDDVGDNEQEAQQLQQQLSEHVQPDYDEAAIRADAERLGDLTAEMTADSIIIQSQIEGVFTQEQRDQLDEAVAQQQQQMQQQMQEQMQQQGG
ncbi:Spy/CpxP family protein refolding chaperone [Vreelandella neptunia]|uniref:Spy/CpxP family protein refolding chaperone n=1 Tax=Vreelandella neptunia TaxID=115551 RepID=A0ABZ0YML7_9GAMM|nr:Spy/CpxP family protein refolding chaperone [Halomonas neptunia]MDN3558403.1 Spy/CpxP family protein refolding chaperone [Halomonas neptunia]TDV98598.1 LTXXQ motif family protein [Halomonas alkaliantarctica]WQH13378.1 Spy/CpxP family protein refolding chaperone [Halomonas neptunia]